MKINVKNQYDGNYHGQGFFYHPSSPRVIDDNFNLVTIGANTVRTNLGDLGNQIVLTVDASNNVTVTDFGAIVGLTPTATILNLPPPYSPFPGSVASIYNNTYNPTTHQFFLRYGYMGGSGPRVVEEILTLN